MKSLILLAIYVLVFVCIYMMLSLVGLVFTDMSYVDILRSGGWLWFYSLFFGWWLAFFPAREYYLSNEEYFDRLF